MLQIQMTPLPFKNINCNFPTCLGTLEVVNAHFSLSRSIKFDPSFYSFSIKLISTQIITLYIVILTF